MDKSYVVILSWMTTELKLSGNDLLVYALIYGFSQDDESSFVGSRSYIANMFNITLPTVDRVLKDLVTKGFIEKSEITIKGVKTNTYKKSLYPIKNLYTPTYYNHNNTTNNISTKVDNYTNTNVLDNNKKINTKVLIEENKNKKKNLYEKCLDEIDLYTANSQLQEVLVDYLKLRLEMKDKPLYFNQWKGLLKKLDTLAKTEKEKIEVVNLSIERGWGTFVEVYDSKNVNNRPWNKSVTSETYDKKKLDKKEKEMRDNGLQTRF